MEFKLAYMKARWNDPHLAEKAGAFFLEDLRNNRECERMSSSATATTPGKASAKTTEAENSWHLGLDNLPEEFLPAPQFLKLLALRRGIRELFDAPLPETEDGCRAAREIMFRRILGVARFFIDRLLYYLLFDKRFHPERKIRASAIQVLRIGNNEAEDKVYYEDLKNLFLSMKLCNILNRPSTPNGSLAAPLAVLRDCGGIFFMTLGAIFPLRAVGKCHMSFSLLMDAIGIGTSTECVAKFIQHMKAMQRAIEDWDAHGGTVAPDIRTQALEENAAALRQLNEKLNALTTTVQSSAKTVANMDRRQRDLFAFIKRVCAAIVRLFQPRKIPPTREQVRNALLPVDRYKCLEHVAEPHRSQIKAVIDHTYKHPIVFRQKKDDDYTLAHAVRGTWRGNEAKWSVLPGTFDTVDDLKSACYNMQKGPNDPFCYRTRDVATA